MASSNFSGKIKNLIFLIPRTEGSSSSSSFFFGAFSLVLLIFLGLENLEDMNKKHPVSVEILLVVGNNNNEFSTNKSFKRKSLGNGVGNTQMKVPSLKLWVWATHR